MSLRVGVLVSGNGTNLQALLDASDDDAFGANVVLVGSNRRDAPAVARATARGVTVCIADRMELPNRSQRQSQLLQAMRLERVDLVVLAGFDEVLSAEFVAEYAGRMINTHPSLLPAFGGTMRAVAEALAHGVKVTGCTVHLVTDDLDAGPILLQGCVEVQDGDDERSLHARILEQEHRLLPMAVRAFADGRVRIEGRRARVIGSV